MEQLQHFTEENDEFAEAPRCEDMELPLTVSRRASRGSRASWASRAASCPEGFDASPWSSPRAVSPSFYRDDVSVDSWSPSSPHGREEGGFFPEVQGQGLIQVVEGDRVRLNMERLINRRRTASDCGDGPHLTKDEVMLLPCAPAADMSCSICLEGFCTDNPPRMLPCQHAFHTDCAVLWLSKSVLCPNCRAPARPEETYSVLPEE